MKKNNTLPSAKQCPTHNSPPSPDTKAYCKSNVPLASFSRITLPASDLALTDLSVLIRLNELKLGRWTESVIAER